MGRPSTADQRRIELLPTIAATFAETGYRRTTTAELARRCEVPENTLFRLWGDKKGMFLAAIDLLYTSAIAAWESRLEAGGGRATAAELLLEYEGKHYGEHGFYRIIFAGLSELDDPDLRVALRGMYRRFHRFVTDRIVEHRKRRRVRGESAEATPELLAWSVLGLGTVCGIGRELGLVTRAQQKALFEQIGRALLRV